MFVFVNPVSGQVSDEAGRLIATGTESSEHAPLIKQMLEFLKLDDVPVKVIAGYFGNAGITGQLIKDPPRSYYILVELDFYNTLTWNEQEALLAHEMGHILYSPKIHLYELDRTGLDICADFFAVKFAGVNAVLSFLDKLYPADADRQLPDYKIRKAVLEAVKMS